MNELQKEERCLTVTRGFKIHGPNNDSFPLISVTGKWLLKSGFKIGDKVSVEVKKGRLIIRKIPRPVASPYKELKLVQHFRKSKVEVPKPAIPEPVGKNFWVHKKWWDVQEASLIYRTILTPITDREEPSPEHPM